jgi:hypothetical protein
MGAAMSYDAARNKIVMFGGFDRGNFNDTWTLALLCYVPAGCDRRCKGVRHEYTARHQRALHSLHSLQDRSSQATRHSVTSCSRRYRWQTALLTLRIIELMTKVVGRITIFDRFPDLVW